MKVAVVGGGVSGLGAAYALARVHDVELFERAAAPGGHVHTVMHRVGGRTLALDAGFLVLNERNYPLLQRLFRELGVRTQSAEMSFSVACSACGLEYAGKSPFAQRRNALRPSFLALLREIARWLREAESSLEDGRYEEASLHRYVESNGYSRRFRDHFLVPLTSALWSTAPARVLDFPAAYAIRFFAHHGMLGFRRLRWQAVAGGSRTYVDELVARLGSRVRPGLPVVAVRRDLAGVELVTADGERRRFDKLVLAPHADQALALLTDPSPDERRTLGAFRYTVNETVVHTDDRLLPRARGARASWNFHVPRPGQESAKPAVTYSLNRLQALAEEREYCVTLNRTADVDPARVIDRVDFEHPVFTVETMRAQDELRALSGFRHTHYAGAHLGNGFHEDGLAAGLRAAAALGAAW